MTEAHQRDRFPASILRHPRILLVGGFFLVYLLIGLAAYDDYGLSNDERIQRQHGLISFKSILSRFDPALAEAKYPNLIDVNDYPHKYYGVAFHLPLVIIEETFLHFPDTRSLWLFRHLATFLFFYAGVAAFYKLGSEKFGWPLGLLGAFLMASTPRLFAESFYNVKDTTFLAAFCIALYFAFRYWRQPGVLRAVLFGAAAAFATNVRAIALFLFLMGIGLVVLDLLFSAAARKSRAWRSIPIALASFCFVLIVTAPASWSDPLNYHLNALGAFSNYDTWRGRNHYLGEFILGHEIPWHYLPVWILITVPVSILSLFGVGALVTVYSSVRNHVRLLWTPHIRENAAFLMLFILPIVGTILLNSTLYTGWRHLTFIMAPMLIIALHGAQFLIARYQVLPQQRIGRFAIAAFFLAISLYQLNIVRWNIVNHPYQNVYFNDALVRAFGGREGFDYDYLRLSVRQALEYILANDSRDRIVVASVNNDTREISKNMEILPPEDAARLVYADEFDMGADYFLDIYRFIHGDGDADVAINPVVVDGRPTVTIYPMADLIANLEFEDTSDGPRLFIHQLPFFHFGIPLDLGTVVYDNPAEAAFTFAYIALPLSVLERFGSEVTFTIIGNGITLENLSQLTCTPSRAQALRAVDGGIAFDLLLADASEQQAVECEAEFYTPVSSSGVLVTPRK